MKRLLTWLFGSTRAGDLRSPQRSEDGSKPKAKSIERNVGGSSGAAAPLVLICDASTVSMGVVGWWIFFFVVGVFVGVFATDIYIRDRELKKKSKEHDRKSNLLSQ